MLLGGQWKNLDVVNGASNEVEHFTLCNLHIFYHAQNVASVTRDGFVSDNLMAYLGHKGRSRFLTNMTKGHHHHGKGFIRKIVASPFVKSLEMAI